MKIDSPSSITSREASIRLEWIYLRILPGVAVLLISIPLCQWLALNLPDGIVPVYLIYIMIVIVLWSIYLAIQYAIAGIVQTRKTMNKVTIENSNSHEEDGQTPVFLLEAMPIVAESNGTESVCDAEVVEEIVEKTTVTDSKVISEETNPGNEPSTVSAASASSTYQQGIDDFYQSQAESQKKKLDTIHEYLLYIMSPFIYEEDMDDFCTDLLSFAMNHNYRPEVEWKRYKNKLSSFDVRHLVLLYRASFCFIVCNSQWRAIVA